MLDSDDRERVRDANPIEDVIQDFAPLIPDGKNLKALCPFHSEKTPSFKVDPARGTYRCFGCGERGDVFSFVMKVEGLEFREALEQLASRAGITLTKGRGGRSPAEKSEREARFDLLVRSQRWFQRELNGERGSEARAYLERRTFKDETLRDFAVGYAPPGWSGLSDTLRRAGGSLSATGVAVGVLKESAEGRRYDAFRDRVIFPIRDVRGRVLGFGARILPRPEVKPAPGEPTRTEAKYLNSQESAIFRKGKLLYGLYEGRDAIRQTRRVYLMEGYTDVMMAHQAGFPQAVATLGTALTEENVEQLCRYADRVTLVFDGDAAGRRAARRAIGLFLDRPTEVGVVLLGEDQDPGDLLSTPEGVETFRRAVDEAQMCLPFLVEELAAEFGVDSGEKKDRVAREFFPFIRQLPSEIRKQEGFELLAAKIAVPLSRVQAEYQRLAASGGKKRPSSRQPEPERRTAFPGDEEAIVLAAMSHPDRSSSLFTVLPPGELRHPILRGLAQRLQERAGLSAIDLEDPQEKAKFLELEERLAEFGTEEERSIRLVRELLTYRLELELRRRRKGVVERTDQSRDELQEQMRGLQDIQRGLVELRAGGTGTQGIGKWSELELLVSRWAPVLSARDMTRTEAEPDLDGAPVGRGG